MKKTDRGESDQLLTVYTKDFGRLEILAKAVRKISSKLRSASELFYLSEIEFIQGKTLKTLTDAVLIDKFSAIRSDLKKLKVAYKVAEDFDNLIKGQEKDPKIWHLLSETFQRLNNQSLVISRLSLVYYYFFWNLASLLGYQPKIQDCFVQGQKTDCDAVKIIKIILRKDWSLLIRLKLEPRYLKSLKSVSSWYSVKIQEEYET
ncbi:MAG: DNA repair protein RecO (recombination protein O) [Parcubacteria group bacterium Gr01-1014_30]|nr:MAG: DNA repair protein RecO (recombination protein O) [Parcubacteria group bacterium Gr01-1014_30]